MKILIILVLSLCGLAISAPTCNYSIIDTKYVCLMTNSTFTTSDTIGGKQNEGKSEADVYRVTTTDPANNDLIKKALETFTNLEVLQIQKGNISSIDGTASTCAKLRELQIWDGTMSEIAETNIINVCNSLEEIDLTGNKLVKIETGSLPNKLKKIILDRNTLTTTSFLSMNFPSLLHLSLSGNGIADLQNLNLLTANLTHLDFSNNQLSAFPAAVLTKNNQIQNFYLNRNNLTSISETFVSSLTELLDLKLGSNLISTIHQDAFKSNAKLTSLDISVNPIKILNQNLLISLTNLKSLDIHEIQLDSTSSTSLKAILEALSNIEKLDISSNTIGAVDTLFSKNVELLDLSISNMKLSQFLNETFSTLTKLQNLTFSSNEIVELPAAIFEKTTAMKRLIANGNKIETLKASTFEKMTNLEVLDFTGNKINKIEKTFFDKLTNLKEVRFGNNVCIKEDFIQFNKNDSTTMGKFQNCFNNYNSARTIVISNILLVLVAAVLKFM